MLTKPQRTALEALRDATEGSLRVWQLPPLRMVHKYRVLDALVAKGFAERRGNQRDLVDITPAGRAALAEPPAVAP